MKLVLQIALGVFIGALATGLTLDVWRNYSETQAKKIADEVLAKQEKARHEEGERIRALLLQSRQNNNQPIVNRPGPDFIPDDAQSHTPLPQQD